MLGKKRRYVDLYIHIKVDIFGIYIGVNIEIQIDLCFREREREHFQDNVLIRTNSNFQKVNYVNCLCERLKTFNTLKQ